MQVHSMISKRFNKITTEAQGTMGIIESRNLLKGGSNTTMEDGSIKLGDRNIRNIKVEGRNIKEGDRNPIPIKGDRKPIPTKGDRKPIPIKGDRKTIERMSLDEM